MKYINIFLLIVITYSCGHREETNSISEEQKPLWLSPDDSIAIQNIITIQTKRGNFEEREKIWAEDGRWLQAFGRVFHGKENIIEFVKLLHNNPGFAKSAITKYSDPEIKVLRPEVVVVHQYHEREGQVIDQVTTPTRRINTTYIITKEKGTWLLRDKVTMDERD